MKVIMYKKDRGDYIINGLCEYWNMPKDKLVRITHKNPLLAERRHLAVYMLYNIADFKLKDIASLLGYKGNSMYSLTEFRERTAEKLDKTYGDPIAIREYRDILKHLGL